MSTEQQEIAGVDRSKKVGSAAAWKKNGIHTIVLHSGTIVDIKIPDLPTLLEAGEIPQNLIEQAVGVSTGSAPERRTPESIKRDREFRDVLITLTVHNPKLTLEDVKEIPAEDKDIIVEFATRQRDSDAEGEHIGGLTKSDKFRSSRGLPSLREVLEGTSSGW